MALIIVKAVNSVGVVVPNALVLFRRKFHLKVQERVRIMPELIILVGLPASGKSTLTKKKYSTYTRVNLDTLKKHSKEVQIVGAAVSAGKDIIIDNTNTLIKERKRFLTMVPDTYTKKCIWLKVEKPICIERNKNRANKVHIVAIHTKAKRFEEPTIDEGFDSLEIL